jgi:tetrahydromethanopterin:alpha-L-glutamate ligase
MQTIAIISDLHDWHSDQIESFLKKYKFRTIKVTFQELKFSFKKNKIFFENNKLLNKVSAVWVRFLKNGTIEEITTKLTILHLLNESKVYVHNSGLTIEKTVDKIRTTGILEINNIKSPETTIWFAKNKKNLNNNFCKETKYLVKPIFGSQGKNIFLVNNFNQLRKIKATGEVFYLQKFIETQEKEYTDVRVLVSNHRVISSMERYSNHFITNVFQGAKYRQIILKKNIKNLCVKLSKIFKLGYGGIDLKITKNDVFVLEINSVPSWKAIQKISKINISQKLVKDFIRNIKK